MAPPVRPPTPAPTRARWRRSVASEPLSRPATAPMPAPISAPGRVRLGSFGTLVLPVSPAHLVGLTTPAGRLASRVRGQFGMVGPLYGAARLVDERTPQSYLRSRPWRVMATIPIQLAARPRRGRPAVCGR